MLENELFLEFIDVVPIDIVRSLVSGAPSSENWNMK